MNRTRAAILTCTLSTFIVNADNSAFNVAVPSAVRDLGATGSETQWVVNAYILALATCVIAAGSLGDKIGKKAVLMTGLSLYIVGSVASSVASSASFLIAARTLSGIGAAALVPLSLAMMRGLSETPKQLTANTALWGSVVGVGMATGPLVGGLATTTGSWRAVPLVNAALGVIFLLCVVFLIQKVPPQKANGFDWLGQVFLITFMISLIYGLIGVNGNGAVVVPVACFFVALASAIIFVRHIFKARSPLIPAEAFHSRPFVFSLISAVANYSCVGGSIFFASLLLQNTAGLSAFTTGLLIIPIAIGVAVGGRTSRGVMEKKSPSGALELAGYFLLAGPALGVVGFGVLGAGALAGLVPAALLIAGVGMGLANTPTNVLSLSELPSAHSGRAGAFASASRQLGQSLGVALVGIIIAALGLDKSSGLFAVTAPWVFLAVAGITVLGIGLFLRERKREPEKA